MTERRTEHDLGAPRLAAWSARHPWRALLAWTAIVAACVGAGMAAGTVLADDNAGSGESGRAAAAVNGADFPADQAENALVRRRDGGQVDQATAAAVRTELARELRGIDGVQAPEDPLLSEDGRAAAITWHVAGDSPPAASDLLAAVGRVGARHPELRIDELGPISIEHAFDETIGKDFQRAEMLSLPVTLAILIVVFGAVVAAGLPLLLAFSAIAAAFGLAGVASHAIPQTDALASVLLLIGVAVGVDYALFMMRRARTERAAGASVLHSVLIASATSGRAVIASGLTVMIAMAGMLFAGDATFTSLGIAAMLVVAAAVAGSLIALPALLRLLGDRIDRVRVPFLPRQREESRIWGAIATRVVRRPLLSLVLGGGALVALSVPAVGMKTRLLAEEDLPRTIPIMRTYDAFTAAFPSKGQAHTLVVRADDVTAAPVAAAIDQLVERARTSRDLTLSGTVEPLVSPDRTVAVLDLPYRGASDGAEATRSLELLRTELVPATIGRVADGYVMGAAAGSIDFNDVIAQRLPLVMAFVVSLTFLLMLAAFRSVSIAIGTVVLNGLSVAAAYGLLALVFQHHWFDGILGIETNGAIVAWLPMFLFVILFGLSMDYHVFVLARVRELWSHGASASDAAVGGVRSTAGVVTSAAIVMIAAFGIFATLSTLDFKQLGVGLAAAIAIDATIVRGVLVPAILGILGERAWRESRIARRLPGLAVEHAAVVIPRRTTEAAG